MVTREEFENYCNEHNLRYDNKCNIYHYELEKNFNKWIFVVVCCNGYLETVKWLSTLKEIDIHIKKEKAFRRSCENGYKEIAEWLYELGIKERNPINIHAKHEDAFRLSCENGYKEIAEWLYDLGIKERNPINIHVCDEDAFRLSCENGYKETAEWLYKLGIKEGKTIDIHIKNDIIFTESCRRERKEIVEWLCLICDDYYIEIENGKIINYGIRNFYERILDDKETIIRMIKKLKFKFF